VYFLAYHRHPLFVKLVQNVNLKQSKHFAFLETSAIQGLSFSRELLAKQILFDVWILEQLNKSVQDYFQLSEKSSDIVFGQIQI
jgi:hypothetical protein